MRNILLILVGVLVVVLSVLTVLLNREIKKTNRLLSEKEQLVNEKENLLPVKSFREGEIVFNGKELSKAVSLSDGKGNSIEWDEIIDNNKLVFYFAETSCDMCVDMEIARLNEKVDLTVSYNTIILISAISKRYVSQYKNNNKLQFPVYEIKSKEEDFPALPFYFVIDKESRRINSAFFPSKYTPDETDKYLNKITEDYFR
jgi:peroxiredoxin